MKILGVQKSRAKNGINLFLLRFLFAAVFLAFFFSFFWLRCFSHKYSTDATCTTIFIIFPERGRFMVFHYRDSRAELFENYSSCLPTTGLPENKTNERHSRDTVAQLLVHDYIASP